MTAPHGTADDYAAAQAKEWGKYVAAFPIDYYGNRAYNTGDPVPVSAVEGDDAWVPQTLVKSTGGEGGATAYEGSQTVVDPAQSTPTAQPAAAPPVSSPDPNAPTQEA